MRSKFLVALSLLVIGTPAAAASLSRSYSYFSIGGTTLEEIEEQLRIRGPHVQSTGQRHPGATRMEFTTTISYIEAERRCRISDVNVSVSANVFLPRWRNRKRAPLETALVWDTLSKDIKRHEESHLRIAKKYARKIEDSVKILRPRASCTELQEKAEALSARILEEHDAAQAHFDRVESINFERRILRLLHYRLEQIEKGRNPG